MEGLALVQNLPPLLFLLVRLLLQLPLLLAQMPVQQPLLGRCNGMKINVRIGNIRNIIDPLTLTSLLLQPFLLPPLDSGPS